MVGNVVACLLTFAPLPTWGGMEISQLIPGFPFRMEKKQDLFAMFWRVWGMPKGLISVSPDMEH